MSLPVKVRDVVDALEQAADFNLHFLDRRTGEILMLTNEEWEAAEEDELLSEYPAWQREAILKAREIQKSEDFAELPDQSDIFEYEMMERFARRYDNREISRRLSGSIQGKSAFRRFKDTLYDLGIQDEWNEFRGKEFGEIAVQWLEEEGIPYTREDEIKSRSETAM